MASWSEPAAFDRPGADHDHATQVLRGWTVQQLLRAALVLLVVLTVVVIPPAKNPGLVLALAAAHLGWLVVVAVAAPRRPVLVARHGWLAVFVDLVALAVLTLVAGRSDGLTWTALVLATGFFLLPVMAATQLRPAVCAAIGVPTVAIYLVVTVFARRTDDAPISTLLLQTGVLAALVLACTLLSRLQRERVSLISRLAEDRAQLLAETTALEQRERRDLAEHLHDGALQYVLAARQDLEDVGDHEGPAYQRVEQALQRSSTLLRSTMSSLHPAVLQQAGLPAALRELVGSLEVGGRCTLELDTRHWPTDLRTSDDPLLHAAARELLTNVVKHARAESVLVRLAVEGDRAVVVVTDDGIGVDPGAMAQRVAEGHVGLWARRARLELEGGGLIVQPGPGGGTRGTAWLPVTGVAGSGTRVSAGTSQQREESAGG